MNRDRYWLLAKAIYYQRAASKTNCCDCQRSGYCGWAFDDKPGKCAMFEKKIRK